MGILLQCPHDVTEREVAVTADGMCPLCLAAEVEQLRKVLAIEGLSCKVQADIERQQAEIERLRADNIRLAEMESETWKSMKAEIERLRALLKSASYHVESENDVSLLTDIRCALECQ